MIEGELVMRFLFEFIENIVIVRFHPPGCGDTDGFELAFHLVFVTKSMRHHVELQRTDRAQYKVIVVQRLEKLRSTFLAQLRQAFSQCFEAQRIFQNRTLEDFRRKTRNTGKTNLLTFGKTVTNIDGAVVVQTDGLGAERIHQHDHLGAS